MAKTNVKAIDTLKAISVVFESKAMKVSKEEISKIGKALYNLAPCKSELEDVFAATTKEACKKAIEAVIYAIENKEAIQKDRDELASKEATEKASNDKEALEKLASDITSNINSVMSSTLLIGQNLCTALDIIKKQGGKQTEFLAWTNDHCGIGKAQAYKLMAVFNSFGSVSAYASTSMRVLYKLRGQSEKVKEEAIALAEKSKLDTNALDKLILKHEPLKVLPTPPTPAITNSPAVQKAIDNGGTLPVTGQAKDTTPRMDNTLDGVDNTIFNNKLSIEGSSSEVIEKQDSTIASLLATIEELRDQLKQSVVVRKESSLPYLPQFDSKSAYTVIGLEPELALDKVAVNKAYRALASIYSKAKTETAASKLLSARDTLLAAIK